MGLHSESIGEGLTEQVNSLAQLDLSQVHMQVLSNAASNRGLPHTFFPRGTHFLFNLNYW